MMADLFLLCRVICQHFGADGGEFGVGVVDGEGWVGGEFVIVGVVVLDGLAEVVH